MAINVARYAAQAGPQGGTPASPFVPSGGPGALDGIAKTVASIGDSIAQAEGRIQARRDAVNRVREANAFSAEIEKDLQAVETDDDITDPAVVERFGKAVRQRMEDRIAKHGGSEESRLLLAERLESLTGGYGEKIVQKSFAAQRQLMDRTVGESVGRLAAQAQGDPKQIDGLFASLDNTLLDLGPAIGETEAASMRSAGRAQIAKSAVSALVERGGYAEARALLASRPDLAAVISPDDQRSINASIIRGEIGEEKAKLEAGKKLAELTATLGRPPTPQERARAAGVAPPQGPQTLSDKIREFEAAVQRPATQEEIGKMAGAAVPGEGGAFGGGLTGRSLDILTRDAEAYGAGLLSPTEERRFASALTQYTQPTTTINPHTGLMESRAPTLPPFVIEAVQRRGLPQGAQPAAGMPAQTGGPGQIPPMQSPGDGRPDQQRTAPSSAAGGRTIFEMASDIAGPLPAIGEALGRTPLVGSVVQAPQMTQARNTVEQLKRDLVRSLSNNPRFSEGERQAIEKDVSIEPQIFDTPQAFRQRVAGIDDALALRADTAFKTANSPAVSMDERKQAMNVLNAIQNFRQVLGAPPQVKSAEEAKKLPPGSIFRDPDGNFRQVPK